MCCIVPWPLKFCLGISHKSVRYRKLMLGRNIGVVGMLCHGVTQMKNYKV